MSKQAEHLQERVDAASKKVGEPADKKAKLVCITSGKGGVGKTSFSVNFALALAEYGKKSVIIDADFGFSNGNIMLGKNSQYSLEHVISGEKTLEDVIEECFPGVWYISGGSGVAELLALKEEQMEKIMAQLIGLEQEMDYILFDTGAGLNPNILRMISASDETILVITPEPTSIIDSYVILKTALEENEQCKISALINRAPEQNAQLTFSNFSAVVKKHLDYDVRMIGFLPEDTRMSQSISAMVPYIIQYPKSTVSMQLRKIAEEIVFQEIKEPPRGLKGFFSRLIRRSR